MIEKAKFTETGNYGSNKPGEDDVYTVAEFREFVDTGAFIDYDGFGHPVDKHKTIMPGNIKPSRLHEIPEDATHIIWYNR